MRVNDDVEVHGIHRYRYEARDQFAMATDVTSTTTATCLCRIEL
jgi:hypothetical protein